MMYFCKMIRYYKQMYLKKIRSKCIEIYEPGLAHFLLASEKRLNKIEKN